MTIFRSNKSQTCSKAVVDNIPSCRQDCVLIRPVLNELDHWPIRMIEYEAAVHYFHQIKLTLQNLIDSVRKFLWIRKGELFLDYKQSDD